MKPKPFASLNHFTIPFSRNAQHLPSRPETALSPRGGPFRAQKTAGAVTLPLRGFGSNYVDLEQLIRAHMDRADEQWRREDKKAKSAAFRETGMQICIELIQQLREIPGVAGVHIMAI